MRVEKRYIGNEKSVKNRVVVSKINRRGGEEKYEKPRRYRKSGLVIRCCSSKMEGGKK
jgi:hypothetical protein